MPYLDVAKLYAGCSGQSADACTLQIHGGVLPRQASLAKSDFFDVPIAAAPLDDVLGRIESRSTPALRANSGGVVLDAWGGEIAQIGPHATAFPHRQARFLAQEFVTFSTRARRRHGRPRTAAGSPACGARCAPRRAAPPTSTTSTRSSTGWAHAYYGANLDRLVEVKRTYDPDDVFRFAQSVPTTLPA